MEKRRPTYDIEAIKAAIGNERTLSITRSAIETAQELGFDREAVADVIQRIDRRMFHKSMPTYADHRMWQDVYRVPSRQLLLYVKFQADLVTEFKLVSFKEV